MRRSVIDLRFFAASTLRFGGRWIPSCVFAVAVVSGPAVAENANSPLVSVSNGKLLGATVGAVDEFKGIPFAKPPVGDLRWRAPQPAAAWPDVRTATTFGPSCLQAGGSGFEERTNPQSEDCLTLNVFTPSSRAARRLPVMVWLYGGGKKVGESSSPQFDGAAIAEQGAVLVTFNYRVGWFGNFAHPALTKSAGTEPVANYGTLDQIAALKWVRQNIESFGGDPGNVTIFGESAGASSVLELMTSPLASGLFEKAASLSSLGRVLGGTLAQAEMDGKDLMSGLGVTTDDPAVLRAIPAAKILATRELDMLSGESPIVDGKVIPEQIPLAFARGLQAKVPLIIGSNDLEIPEIFLATKDGVAARARVRLTDKQEAKLRTLIGPGENYSSNLISDLMFTEPARYFAWEQAKVAKVYRYRFSVISEAAPTSFKAAAHSFGVPYVFRTTATKSFSNSPKDAELAKAISAYWVTFARTGDPNGPGRPVWPIGKGSQILNFTNAGPIAETDPRSAILDEIAAAYGGSTPPFFTGGSVGPSEALGATATAASAGGRASTEATRRGFSTDTPIETLVADPVAKALLDRIIPGITTHSRYEQFKSMSLKQLHGMAPRAVPVEKLDELQVELGRI